MAENEPLHTVADEVAAAEAELKAAQEKLEAAKAKLAEGLSDEASVEQAAIVADDTPLEVEAVIVEEVGDLTGADASEQYVAADSAPKEAEPQWVPYSTAQVPPANGAYPQQPYPGAVPPVGYGADAPYQAPAGYTQPQYAPPQSAPHAGPGAVPPQQPYYGYQQPYYQQPYAQPIIATKDHVVAGLLAIFLGWLGIHKFYLGYNTSGFIMLGVSILGGILTLTLASWVIWVIAIVEGILYLTKSQSEFEQTYVLNKREWF